MRRRWKTASSRPCLLAGCACLFAACFGKVQSVPAAQAPKPPPGKGWSCVDASVTDEAGNTQNRSACFRTEEACNQAADGVRDQEGWSVGACQSAEKAWCSAVFTDESDARFECVKAQAECGSPYQFEVAVVPGSKRSECAEYD
jgi:hypothetical protein